MDDWLMPALLVAVGVVVGIGMMLFANPGWMPTVQTQISNKETWDLIEDENGNLKRIEVHRNVRRN